jgi:Ca-activated chloride channel family protein
VSALLAASLTVSMAGRQEAQPRSEGPSAIRILAPTGRDFVAGPTRLEATVESAQPGDRVEFFVDGRSVGAAEEEPWAVTWPADSLVRGHVVTAVLMRGGREVASGNVHTRDPGFTSTATVQAVALAPVVTDSGGRYVLGLSQRDFTVLDDGAPQNIDTFEATDSPLDVVLVLDVSGSMQSKIGDAVRAASAFLDALKPEDEAALLTFNTTIVGSIDLTVDRGPLHAALRSARPDGETALYDVLAAALRKLKPLNRRKAIVVFTDGEDNRSRLSVDQVIAMARASEVSIYAIAQGTDESKTLRVFLDRIAEETGGRSFFIGHIRRLGETFGAIITELRSQYFMTYVPAAGAKAHQWHEIQVRVARADARVRVKKEYFLE